MIEIDYYLTKYSFCSISRDENVVVIPLMTELDEPFSGVCGASKLYVDKLIPIRDLIP